MNNTSDFTLPASDNIELRLFYYSSILATKNAWQKANREQQLQKESFIQPATVIFETDVTKEAHSARPLFCSSSHAPYHSCPHCCRLQLH